MKILTDLKSRGLEDNLINATDNITGFTQTIKLVFPQSQTQLYLVHQIRNSTHHVIWKDKKSFAKDMKQIYDAATRQAAKASLEHFSSRRNHNYSYAEKAWEDNWEELTVFLTSR